MPQNPEQPHEAGTEWYAVDADGESALRIADGFTLGEAPSGALALGDSRADRRWLQFHVDSQGLWVDVVAADQVLVDDSGASHRRQLLEHGTRLELPNNTLQVSHDIQPARLPGPRFRLVAQQTEQQPVEPAPSSRGPAVLEVVADLRQQLGMAAPGASAPERPSVGGASGRTGSEPQADLWQRARQQPAPASFDLEEGIPEPPRHDRATRYRSHGRRRGESQRAGPLLIGLAAVAVGIAVALLVRDPALIGLEEQVAPAPAREAAATPPAPAADSTATPGQVQSWSAAPDSLTVRAAAPAPRAPDEAPPDRRSDLQIATTDRPAPDRGLETAPTVTADAPDQGAAPPSAPPAAPVESSPSTAPQARFDGAIDQQLAVARQLLQEGEITSPPGSNAVAVLLNVLERSPDHQQARALLAQCGDRLVASAVRYREQGQDYQARNTLEEVLSFAPDHAEARRLWREWVGSTP